MDGSTALSSNWKLLQARLKAGDSASSSSTTTIKAHAPSKRTRDTDSTPKNTSAAISKRSRYANSNITTARQANSTSTPGKKRKMNNHTSTTTNSTPSLPTTTTSQTNIGLTPSLQPGKYVSLDCEMVGTAAPPSQPTAQVSILARVSIVTYTGAQLYDSYVLPLPSQLPITDYRTQYSGITPACLRPGVARPFAEVQTLVRSILKDRILVGHSVQNDLKVLGLTHPKRDIRDTARYSVYRNEVAGGGWPRLKDLAERYLGLGREEFQGGDKGHDSVEDARVTMMLFRREKSGVEGEVQRWFGKSTLPNKKGAKVAGQVVVNGVGSGHRKQKHDEEVDGEDVDSWLESYDEEDSDDIAGTNGAGVDGQTDAAAKNRKPRKKKKKKRK